MKATKHLLGGCAALLFALTASAQMGPGAGMGGLSDANAPGGMAGMGRAERPAMDCSKARNPERCEARQKAMETCKDKRGKARQSCVEDSVPAPDCGKAQNAQRCEARQKAREACKGKLGKERRVCQRENAPQKKAKKNAGQRGMGGMSGMGMGMGGMQR